MTAIRWLCGRLYGRADLPPRWVAPTVMVLSMTVTSWVPPTVLWAATPPGTTDPTTMAPADPSLAPALIGLCLLLVGVVALIATSIRKEQR